MHIIAEPAMKVHVPDMHTTASDRFCSPPEERCPTADTRMHIYAYILHLLLWYDRSLTPTVSVLFSGIHSTDGTIDVSALLKQIGIAISNSACAIVIYWYYSKPGTSHTNLRSRHYLVLQ